MFARCNPVRRPFRTFIIRPAVAVCASRLMGKYNNHLRRNAIVGLASCVTFEEVNIADAVLVQLISPFLSLDFPLYSSRLKGIFHLLSTSPPQLAFRHVTMVPMAMR